MADGQPPIHFINFPPFPTPPPGVQLTPWKDFKPAGIQIKLEDNNEEPELDGTGVPTTALLVKHDLTEAERKKKQKKLHKKATGPSGEVLRLTWYDEWEQGEALRICYTDSALSRVDRLYQAAQDFKSGRPWPGSKAPALWDQWRHFIGLIAIIQSVPRKKYGNAEEDEEENEEEEEKPVDEKDGKIDVVGSIEARARFHKEEEDRKGRDSNQQARKDYLEELRDSRLEEFLSDPALCTKIFFSAHYRDKGLIWNDSHCRDGPILIHFFFNYLIRSRVFPEPELNRVMRQALEVCEVAKQELPLTHIIAKSLDDGVSKGFQEMMSSSRFCDALYYEKPDKEDEPEVIKVDEEEKEKKQREIEILKDAIGDPSLQIIDPDAMDLDTQAVKDAVKDNVDINGAPVNPTNGWGSTDNDDNVNVNVNAGSGGWGSSATQEGTTTWTGWGSGDISLDKDWFPTIVNVVFEILGPTTLPITHTTGIVESSTRRIVRVIPPKDALKPKVAKNAEAVEDDLTRRFAQLVLAPWARTGNHVASDISSPMILPDSRGPYVPISDGKNEAEPVPSDPRAFNPLKDEITVLIHPANVAHIRVGMGIGATFVQLARKDPNSDEPDVMPPPLYLVKDRKNRKRGGPGKNGAPTNWWYIEHLRFAIPSFHTDKYYSDQE